MNFTRLKPTARGPAGRIIVMTMMSNGYLLDDRNMTFDLALRRRGNRQFGTPAPRESVETGESTRMSSRSRNRSYRMLRVLWASPLCHPEADETLPESDPFPSW